MSRVHVLETRDGRTRVVLHFDMPPGNNSVGKTWKACWVNAGRAVTSLTEGTGPGQITTAEKLAVELGDVVEVVSSVRIDRSETGANAAASLDHQADKAIESAQTDLAEIYRFYGRAQ